MSLKLPSSGLYKSDAQNEHLKERMWLSVHMFHHQN